MGEQADVRILRELAKQYVEIANKDAQEERRELWRRHNSLEKVRPPVLVGAVCRTWPADISYEIAMLRRVPNLRRIAVTPVAIRTWRAGARRRYS